MKFYYNGKLIRTSKNHIYTHAVINNTTGALIGCRKSLELAEAIKTGEINRYYHAIAEQEAAIKALKAGKKGIWLKDGRHSWYKEFTDKHTVEYFEECIESLKRSIEYFSENWEIVELEAREN